MARQWFDVFSPANSPWTNPEVLRRTRAEAGMKRAEEVMSVAPHEIDFERARLAMLRTLQQMQAESRRGGGHV